MGIQSMEANAILWYVCFIASSGFYNLFPLLSQQSYRTTL